MPRRTTFTRSLRPALLFTVLAILGCARASLAPPEIQVDRTACAKCRMLISETQYAAAFYNGEGDNNGYHIFDDIGCMVRDLRSVHTQPRAAWVHDLPSNTWLLAESATYVYAPSIGTPMSYGYVAFRDSGKARSFALEHAGHVIEGFHAVAKAMEEIAK